MSGYTGAIVGGPFAGQRLDSPHHWHRCLLHKPKAIELEPGPARPLPATVAYDTFVYVHRVFYGLEIWAPEGWEERDVVHELLKGYRPLADLN